MDERKQFATGLRQLANMIDKHWPEGKPLPYVNIYRFADGEAEMSEWAKIPGGWAKEYGEAYFELRREFGPKYGNRRKIKFEVCVARDKVCTKRVVGTEYVPPYTSPGYTREIVEWDCKPTGLLANG